MVTPRKSAFKFSGSSCCAHVTCLCRISAPKDLPTVDEKGQACLATSIAGVHGDEEAHTGIKGDGCAVCENKLALAFPYRTQHAVHLPNLHIRLRLRVVRLLKLHGVSVN